MIKTKFEFNDYKVVALAHSSTGIWVNGLVVKFVDQEGDRIYPEVSRNDMDEIEEMAEELLTEEQFESELIF